MGGKDAQFLAILPLAKVLRLFEQLETPDLSWIEHTVHFLPDKLDVGHD